MIITNENVRDYQVNGVWSIAGSMRPDNESKEVKKFTLKVKFANVPLADIVNAAIGSQPTKVQWCNGPGRKHFDTWKNNQVVDVDFKSPGRAPQLTAMEQFRIDARAAGVDVEDKAALTAYITEQLDKI